MPVLPNDEQRWGRWLQLRAPASARPACCQALRISPEDVEIDALDATGAETVGQGEPITEDSRALIGPSAAPEAAFIFWLGGLHGGGAGPAKPGLGDQSPTIRHYSSPAPVSACH